MYESYFQLGKEYYFLLHSELKSSRPTLLFIHGLGDASVDYRDYLTSNLIDRYNILVPDLLGYGKSSASSDYSFKHQVDGIEQHIFYLQKICNVELSNFILISHSMGSIHATLLCESSLKKLIKAFINVEGSITQFGSFIAEKMMNAIAENKFPEWYKDFKQTQIYENLAQKNISIRPYYAALEFCQTEAFLENGKQMYLMSHELTGKYTHIIGKKYTALPMQKIYCYGDSLSKETIAFLHEHNLKSHHFKCNNHFLLSECFNEFIIFIDEYIENLPSSESCRIKF
ncbi:MAG: hypothetical protein A3F11_10200 [Gammaproteobacteria bacterium RIFCSPHIGHO2_12_FULL_37_14]|nr:MAG: hypothetical protein A3F11_10200 [Gammaproteobacteria bacterium RIFCSPHIGHO2_12_FULL_37_14]